MNLLFFDILVLIMIGIDTKLYKHLITPFSVISLVYIALINLNNLVAVNQYGFNPVFSETLNLLLLYFFEIFLIDVVFSFFFRHMKTRRKRSVSNYSNYNTVFWLFIIGLGAYFLSFVILYAQYGMNVKGKQSGILGHLSSFAYIMAPVYLDLAFQSSKKGKKAVAVILNILLAVLGIMFGGKYVILINFVYIAIYFFTKQNKRISRKMYVLIASGIVLFASGIFLIIYSVIPVITGSYGASATFASTSDFAIRHFFFYLLGSVIGNNYTMAHAFAGDPQFPFAVLINIAKAIVGNSDYVAPIYKDIFPTGSGVMTNVSGLFGELTFCLGKLGASAYLIVVFFIVNVFYCFNRNSNRYNLTNAYSLAGLALMFFCNFYSVSGYLLPLIFAMIFDTLFQFTIKLR